VNERLSRFRDVSSCETEDRRRDPRFPASASVEIEIQKPGAQRVQGTVFEVSRSGLGLDLPLALEAGTRVKINLKDVVMFGEVRHCRAARTGFTAGVFVSDVSVPEKFDQLNDRELDLYSILLQFAQLR
jgi:hypothetical protein